MNVTLARSLRLVIVAPLLACSGGADEASAKAPVSAQARAAITACSGTFRCDSASGSRTTTLTRASGVCRAGAVRLDDGGHADVDGASWSWSAEGDTLRVCDGAATCVTCRSVVSSPEPEAREEARTCRGAQPSCYGRAAGACAEVAGCYGGWHVRWDGELEFECKGSASSCASFGSQGSCETHLGCSWE